MTKRTEWVLVAALVAAGFLIRAYHFGIIPVGLNQDEAMAAVDAKALAEYGTDRFGMRYPVHLAGWIVGQMSALLSYIMVPFIDFFGFSITSIRLPMLVMSCIGLVCLYFVGKRIGGAWTGLIVLALGVICPWHYLQSRWSLDCNTFPHIFLMGVCLFLAGLDKCWAMYVSMVFFGLCSYCYGIANYSVPLFLLASALILMKKKAVSFRQVMFCAAIYLVVAGPELLTMLVNVFKWQSITLGCFTIPRFPDGVRTRNTLFFNFSWKQLWDNIRCTLGVLFFNRDICISNSIAAFGPLYHFTPVFFLIGLGASVQKIRRAETEKEKLPFILILLWLAMGAWIGIVTEDAQIHRLNVIFYAMLLLSAVGIRWCVEKCRGLAAPIFALYTVSALLFARSYFGDWAEQSRDFYYESYINALYYADTLPCDYYYISADPQGAGVREVGRILTMFCHEIDAAYFQGKTNVQDGVERLPYEERYTYYVGDELTEETLEANRGKSVVYLVGCGEAPLFSEEEYNIVSFYDSYFVASPK